MTIYYFTPYSLEKSLAEAYNESCELVPGDDDWICLRDGDTMFLNSDWGHIIQRAVDNFSTKFSAFTCYASRIEGKHQQFMGEISEEANIVVHRKIAVENADRNRGKIKDISGVCDLSGHFILIPKWLWKRVRFNELNPKGGLLGVDNYYFWKLNRYGYKIGLIEELYLFHYYRLAEGSTSIKHLL